MALRDHIILWEGDLSAYPTMHGARPVFDVTDRAYTLVSNLTQRDRH